MKIHWSNRFRSLLSSFVGSFGATSLATPFALNKLLTKALQQRELKSTHPLRPRFLQRPKSPGWKQSLFAFTLGLFLFGSFAAAHEDHFPEGTLLALEGQDAISKKECQLFVIDVGFTGVEQTAEQWYATVLTSYSHDGDSADALTVKVHPTRPGTLFGKGANGQDEIVISLDPQTLDLRNAKSFNLKWLHGRHFHTNRCLNLKVHEE